jgi:hypothetical protein
MTTALLVIGIALLAVVLACVIATGKRVEAILALVALPEDERARLEAEEAQRRAEIAIAGRCGPAPTP